MTSAERAAMVEKELAELLSGIKFDIAHHKEQMKLLRERINVLEEWEVRVGIVLDKAKGEE